MKSLLYVEYFLLQRYKLAKWIPTYDFVAKLGKPHKFTTCKALSYIPDRFAFAMTLAVIVNIPDVRIESFPRHLIHNLSVSHPTHKPWDTIITALDTAITEVPKQKIKPRKKETPQQCTGGVFCNLLRYLSGTQPRNIYSLGPRPYVVIPMLEQKQTKGHNELKGVGTSYGSCSSRVMATLTHSQKIDMQCYDALPENSL